MPTDRTKELLQKYADMRQAREREHGSLPEGIRSEEALDSARTAMALAGHPVPAGVAAPVAA